MQKYECSFVGEVDNNPLSGYYYDCFNDGSVVKKISDYKVNATNVKLYTTCHNRNLSIDE